MLLIPMCTAAVMTCFFWTAEVDAKWKIAASVLTTVSLLLQWVVQVQIHFVIPLLMQTLVAICLSIYFKTQYF